MKASSPPATKIDDDEEEVGEFIGASDSLEINRSTSQSFRIRQAGPPIRVQRDQRVDGQAHL